MTQDHLDYHGTMKITLKPRLLFTELPNISKVAAINSDDPWGEKLLTMIPNGIGFAS